MDQKIGIVSNHIILFEYSYPVFGIILISSEIIENIQIFEKTVTIAEIQSMYSDYQIIDYSNHFISPGIIDLNTRKE